MEMKDTLNLPITDFPMKASLTQREPEMLAHWEKEGLYKKIRQSSKGKPKFVFHDGPPYANGHIHMGHALNKLLKDFIVKIMNMKGFDSGFIPGWDCHGLPIEHQVGKKLKEKKLSLEKSEIRKQCRIYAQEFVEIQREEFKRLGVFADWENPYLTMNYSYEATIVREFGKFVENGLVYKGLKPVHWCTSCQTALAEAEVEHADHTSPSIYVKFPVDSGIPKSMADVSPENLYMVIWTTTPWTLPANLAICLHPEFTYVAVSHAGDTYIVAEDRLPALVTEWELKDYKILASSKGADWENSVCHHPFIDQESKVILGEHVTLEQGTGCVHTAPGHGQDDYIVGLKYGLEPYNPVNNGGVFVPEVEHFGGMFVRKADLEIIEKLRQDGFLILDVKIKHSYPHCWRCHQPIIFRATNQWFISMDKKDLRENALAGIDRTQWIPEWGRERIYSMVENRPDWCVSRQRAWGVPITLFTCNACGEFVNSSELFERIAEGVEKHGADFWFDAEELLPQGTVCQCGGKEFSKENDILDVWFDSGVSHVAVIENDPELHWPADLYLEGSDQHRGWFHSSLLESIGTRGKEPYKAVLTHGYVVDGKGKKMSKSAGNVIAPEKIIDQHGAEILRLWVASENYREDIRVSNEILKRLTESYRKIRNTFRYLLGNLHDFDYKEDRVPVDEMVELDRYILYRFNVLRDKILTAYENYEFHVFYHSFSNFCIVELSAFYLDIIKDRLYTYPVKSHGRRSGQTALHILMMGMVRLMAPILSFTSEEIWSYLPKKSADEESVHLSKFPEPENVGFDDAFVGKWEFLVDLKGEVSKALETSRREKVIGHSLDSIVKLELPAKYKSIVTSFADELKYIFIVSEVQLVDNLSAEENIYESNSLPGVKVFSKRHPGKKCERCWHYFEPDAQAGKANGEICLRCEDHLQAAGA